MKLKEWQKLKWEILSIVWTPAQAFNAMPALCQEVDSPKLEKVFMISSLKKSDWDFVTCYDKH